MNYVPQQLKFLQVSRNEYFFLCQIRHGLGLASNLVASGWKRKVISHAPDFVHP